MRDDNTIEPGESLHATVKQLFKESAALCAQSRALIEKSRDLCSKRVELAAEAANAALGRLG